MSHPIKVCLWATTFQANIYAMTRYLAREPARFSPLVVMEGLERYRREPIERLAPLDAPMVDRDRQDAVARVKAFAPDVLVVDNHYPGARLAPALVNVWHGFGWRGPEDRASFKNVYAAIAKHTGLPADAPNPYLRWITAGNTNLEHRVHVTGLHPENLRAHGQPYLDEVAAARFSRAELEPFYPASFRGRRIALFAPTWHFGRIFAHWGDEWAVLERLFAFLAEREVALIFRMHDRKRFEPAYLAELERLAARNPHVLLKYKDEHQDNLIDMAISDLLISNYSSILTYFYATGRPTIHVQPVDRENQASVYRYWKYGKVREKVTDASYIWSLDPDQHGGLAAETQAELEAQIERALADPGCCAEATRAFFAKHCAPNDGKSCARVADEIEAVARYARARPPTRRGLLASLFSG